MLVNVARLYEEVLKVAFLALFLCALHLPQDIASL